MRSKTIPGHRQPAEEGRVTGWRVLPIHVPEDLDAPEAWAIHGDAAVRRAAELDRQGHDDLASRAPAILASLQLQTYFHNEEIVAVPDDVTAPTADDVVGYGFAAMPRTSNPHLAYVGVEVHPDQRRQGAGTALLAEVERIAADEGRTVLISWAEQIGEPEPGSPDALEPPTGSGRVRASEPCTRLALGNGYLLEQAERYSVLTLPVNPALLTSLHDNAAARAGSDYRLHTWVGATPPDRIEQIAALRTKMSTDTPSAGLAMDEDRWDEGRVHVADERLVRSGLGALTTAVEHVPSGTLAGFTRLEFPLDRPGAVFQEDTIVLAAHRGHRLGMLMKTHQLRTLPQVRPDAHRIHTWNAEENSYMLAINVALGYRPTGVTGSWQKRLG
jgi:GNAT superfamily N-acetyltransferase